MPVQWQIQAGHWGRYQWKCQGACKSERRWLFCLGWGSQALNDEGYLEVEKRGVKDSWTSKTSWPVYPFLVTEYHKPSRLGTCCLQKPSFHSQTPVTTLWWIRLPLLGIDTEDVWKELRQVALGLQFKGRRLLSSVSWCCWLNRQLPSKDVCAVWSVAQLYPTLCNPMDCSPRGSSVHGFSGQEYWSGLPCSPPGDLSNPGIEPRSPALQEDSLPFKPLVLLYVSAK